MLSASHRLDTRREEFEDWYQQRHRRLAEELEYKSTLAETKAWLSGWLEGWRVHRDLLHLQGHPAAAPVETTAETTAGRRPRRRISPRVRRGSGSIPRPPATPPPTTPPSSPTAPAEGPNGPGWSPLFPQRPTCFSPPPAGLFDTGPKAQNGVGPKVT